MRETKTYSIDGQEYDFYYINPTKALRLLTRLIKIALGPVGGAFGGGGVSAASVLETTISLDGLFARLAENLDEDVVTNTIKEIMFYVRHKGGAEIIFDDEFEGNMWLLMKLVRQALEVNYGDFFDGIKAGIGTLKRTQGNNPGLDKKTSTGSSGDQSLPKKPRSAK